MASELITGFAGTPHVGSDDMGAFQAGILGVGSYVLQTGQQLKATVASANKITIGTGDLVMNGRHVRMATATDLTIQNGAQGQKRNDLIVCRYQKTSDGKETATLMVIKGTATTGTPADPSYNKTSILDGASVSDMPLYRIPITNLSVGTPVQLFEIMTPLKTVGDSVTQSLSFDRSGLTTSGDVLAIGGQVFDREGDQHLAVVTIRWVNNGAFSTTSWGNTVLARMIGWEATREAMSPCMENIAYEHLGKNAFYASGKDIGYKTPGGISIGAGSWHNGCLVFPVKPA